MFTLKFKSLKLLLGSLLCASALYTGGCDRVDDAAPAGTEDESSDKVILPAGKADNYFSNQAQEYLATTQATLTLDETAAAGKSDAERLALAQEVMGAKAYQVSWFLHVYLIDKDENEAAGNYGGMQAMVTYRGEQASNLRPVEGQPNQFTFDFQVQVGGTVDLIDKVREDQKLSGAGPVTFSLDMAKIANEELAFITRDNYGPGTWSPATCGCELESVKFTLTPIAPSADAYLDYQRLLEDDVMDIGVHVGWDYHARYDLVHSRQIYDFLTSKLGFHSPAESFEKYDRLSGPLTKKLTVNGRTITMQVSLFHPDPCESWDEAGRGGSWAKEMRKDENYKKRTCPDFPHEQLEANANSTTDAGAGRMMDDLKNSLRTRDVIIFSGHSGYTFGFSLAGWFTAKGGDLDPPDIKKLDMPSDKSQIVLMAGCETYHNGQAFREISSKSGLLNLDVITTSSFSDATSVDEVKQFLRALVGDEQNDGQLRAQSYGRLLTDINPVDDSSFQFPMYGVHGIDDNPRANPLADASKAGQACQKDTDCGASGNVCVQIGGPRNQRVCAVECVNDAGCSEGQTCRSYGKSSSMAYQGRACVK